MSDVKLKLSAILGSPSPQKHPVYRAKDQADVFMYDEFGRLRWFPNPETFHEYGYSSDDVKVQDISWFYDKPIVESIRDIKTGKTYPAEETPNYQIYRSPEWALAAVARQVPWWRRYLPWFGVGGAGLILLVILIKRRRK